MSSDITPTSYDMLGVDFPEKVKGYEQMPLHGVSFAHTLDDPEATTRKTSQFYGLLGTRSIWADGWKGRPFTLPSVAGVTSVATGGSCTTPTTTRSRSRALR